MFTHPLASSGGQRGRGTSRGSGGGGARAETKNQWARDDPCFVVLVCALVAAAATAYCVAFGHTLWHSLLTILSAVLVDFLALGAVLASAGWCAPHHTEIWTSRLSGYNVL